MRPTSFVIERCRSFADETVIPIKPLTIVFGYNSSGKSTILRTLATLAASMQPKDVQPLALDCPANRGARFVDLLSKQRNRKELQLTIHWQNADTSRSIRWHFESKDFAKHELTQFAVSYQADSWAQFISAADGSWSRLPSSPSSSWQPESPLNLQWNGLVPTWPESAPPGPVVFYMLTDELRAFGKSVHWLGAVRAEIPNKGEWTGRSDAHVDNEGSDAPERIAKSLRDRTPLGSFVNDALKKMFGRTIYLNSNYSEEYRLEMSPLDAPMVLTSVRENGEGITQVLPVLSLLGSAKAGMLGQFPVLCIEQPEMHLHPHAEEHLVTFIAEVVQSATEPAVIVETHSAIFLLAAQLAVARGQLEAKDVAVLWVDCDSSGVSTIRTLSIDPKLGIVGWPEAVFTEDVELARELFFARRAGLP